MKRWIYWLSFHYFSNQSINVYLICSLFLLKVITPSHYFLVRVSLLSIILVDLIVYLNCRLRTILYYLYSLLLLSCYFYPIHLLEQFVPTHLGQPFLWVLLQRFFQKPPHQRRHTLINLHIRISDIVNDWIKIICWKRMKPMQHLKQNYTHCVNVTLIVDSATIVHESLRSQVQRRPQKTMSFFLIILKLFRQTKICQVKMPISINQNILRF